MKLLKITLLLAVFCLTFNSNARAQDTWTEHVYTADKMAITSPGDMTLKTESVDTAVGPVSTNFYSCSQPSGDYFGIVSCTYPAAVAEVNSQKLLEGARDGMLNGIKATKTAEKAIAIDGHPGMEVSFDVTSSGIAMKGVCRFYLVGASLFQVQVLGPSVAKEDSDKFLDSFRLIP